MDLGALAADSLEVGLAAAFGKNSGPPRSSVGHVRPVLLKEAEGESSLVVKPTSDAIPLKEQAGDRYRFDGEIARGGMGAVLRGRDVDLGRALAVKVLLEKYANRPDVARRFIEEAQIGGQLQHPGVVPIYDIGRFGDRPFFTMKLVKGQTLTAILGERTDPSADRPRLLGIALHVSQAMAYVHAKGVIHRDLKPANIMVGAFGEVQVMDWGLAKVLAEGGIHDEERAIRALQEPQETVIRTARSTGFHGSFGTDTEAGSILGTPAYMAPEQASGDIAHLNRRADVFGLGAILCEILTGKAPYVGRSSEEVRRKAANGDLADATARLDGCGADAELIALTKKCLSPDAIDRLRDAQAVADGLSDYLAGVQERLQQAERERAVAEAKAVEERRRRRVQLALAASILAFTALGGLSTTYFLQQRAEGARLRVEQAAAVDRIVGQAVTLRDQAKGNPEDVARWQVALAAVKQAEAAGDEAAAPRLLALREEIQAGLDAAQRDKTLLDRLVDIRSAEADDQDGSISDRDYADAFREAGIDVARLSPAEAGARIKARPPSVATALASALDDWESVRRDKRKDAAGAASQSQAAQIADPDPWRTDLRNALNEPDKAARLTRLQALEKKANYDALGPISLHLLGSGLIKADDPALAESVLRKTQERHPRDVWINYVLGQALEKLSRGDEAIRFYTAARAIRPETAHELAHSLGKRGDRDEAIAVFRDLRGLRRGNARHLGCLGEALKATGRTREAEEAFEAAIVAGREEVRLKPGSAYAHFALGRALKGKGQLDEAIAGYRKAIELDSKLAAPHINLGTALKDKGQVDEAIACYRKAIELDPKNATAQEKLGNALKDKSQWDEASACYRKAIELDPNFAIAHNNLGAILCDVKRDYDAAIVCFRKAVKLAPKQAAVHANLGTALQGKGQVDEAIACYKKGIELDPTFAVARTLLANAQLMAAVQDKLLVFLKGQFQPTTSDERLGLGNWCENKKLHHAATSLYAAAFAADPKPGDDLNAGHRYAAARFASLAAAGLGEDAAKLDNAERTRLRKQALEWLRADLALRTKQLESGKPADRAAVQQTVRGWQKDTDLAGIRDAAALANLSGEEQKACSQLWTDVAALLKKANAPQSLGSLLQQLPEARKALPKESPQLAGLLAQIGLGLLEQKKWTEAEPHLEAANRSLNMSKVAFLGLGAMGSRMWNPHLIRDAESMLTDNFETQFPVRLLEKDLGYTVQTGGGEASMPTVSAVRSIFRRAIDENFGNLNVTAIARLFSVQPPSALPSC